MMDGTLSGHACLRGHSNNTMCAKNVGLHSQNREAKILLMPRNSSLKEIFKISRTDYETAVWVSHLGQCSSTGGPQGFYHFVKNYNCRHNFIKIKKVNATKSSRNIKMSKF